MERGGRICTLTTVFLFLMPDFASSANIIQGPQNATVLSGSNPSFTCIVQAGWQSINWYLSGVYAVNIMPAGTTIMSNALIVAQNSTDPKTGAFTTTITLINVNKGNSGVVQCSSLSTTAQDAYLSVQVKGSAAIVNGSSVTVTPNSTVDIACRASGWHPAPTITWEINGTSASNSFYFTDYTTGTDDLMTGLSTFTIRLEADTNLTCLTAVQSLPQPESATVAIAVREAVTGNNGSGLSRTDIILIAVFVTLGGLLLLAIIIIIIVICCKKKKKKKKETGYQSEAWKAPQRDVSNRRITDSVLPGEHINWAFTPEPLSVAPNLKSNHSDSAYSEAPSTLGSNHYQVTGHEWGDDDHLKKIRHVTHV